MRKSIQYILARITLFGIGTWLLISMASNKKINFTRNRMETIAGALTALGIVLFFLWFANYKQKREKEKDNHLQNK